MLPLPWVERIFAKLALVYGRDFLSRWEGQELGAVMGDWAHELDGFEAQPQAIRYALEHLPTDKPPTVLQFREIARRGPSASLPQLPEPPSDPARVASAMAQLAMDRSGPEQKSPAQTCIDNIERIVANRGGVISSAQKHMVAHCLRMPGTSTTLAVEVAA